MRKHFSVAWELPATGKKQVAAEDGIVEIMKLIRRLGHDPKDYKIADGCGLSIIITSLLPCWWTF